MLRNMNSTENGHVLNIVKSAYYNMVTGMVTRW